MIDNPGGGERPAPRRYRCRGAVIRGREILLIEHRNRRTGNVYWWLPGGGLEPGETDEQCVEREVIEETGLDVRVERLLSVHRDQVIYLCTTLSQEVWVGTERGNVELVGFGWYPVDDERTWEPGFYEDHVYPILMAVQQAILEENP